ncbi:ABC transporter ATP-binding protein [Angustibacter sp. McL0619]|uniref:ABC transporter ATP-binding protein n=1 Tax=Angustibacter sp. McL0619 TaxID=3415676 RepID=UPI003CEAB2F8
MIRFEAVSVQYADALEPVLRAVNLDIDEGELALVVGATGSGKTTLLRCVNGLVPHFSGGTLSGRVLVDGRDTRTHRPRDLADIVGIVGQNPTAAFVTDTVEEELAYGLETLGLAGDVMRKRVEETLDLMGLADLRARALRTLSGGQAQRVAIGGVLAAHPRVLVLDEPTSALDPVAAEEVLAALTRLVHDLGLTVLLAEHRLERVVQYADRVVTVVDGLVTDDDPRRAMATAPVAPPVVALGRLAGWEPLPLSVREARRHAEPLRRRLADAGANPYVHQRERERRRQRDEVADEVTPLPVAPAPTPALRAERLVVDRGQRLVLRRLALTVRPGEVVALMGRNGAGKSTLLAAAAGQLPVREGVLLSDGLVPADLRPRELVQHVGLVPQDPGLLLYADSVAAECRSGDADMSVPSGTVRALLRELAPDVQDGTHPRDLSEGQRLALALSIVLAGEPPLVLLDEPTRGLDYGAKARLVHTLRALAVDGRAVLLATHDVELVADVADRVALLAEGEIVADGPTVDVLGGSPAFAPQVAKVMHPQPWLNVADLAAALEAS